MNSLWIQRISDYSHSPLALKTSKLIIHHKILRQQNLLKKYNCDFGYNPDNVLSAEHITDVLLSEGRFAQKYWKQIQDIVKSTTNFHNRRPGAPDHTNKLLDIGYHHLTNKTKTIFANLDMNCSIGLFHKARSKKSSPLAYDLVELFRADIVDTEMVKFFHLKKKPVEKLSQTDISHFLFRINTRLQKPHYLKNFNACRSYIYYMELQILHFSKSVRKKEIFLPTQLPGRHETRC